MDGVEGFTSLDEATNTLSTLEKKLFMKASTDINVRESERRA